MLFLCCQLLFVCLLAANKFEPCPLLTSSGRLSIINVTVVIVVVDAAAASFASAAAASM